MVRQDEAGRAGIVEAHLARWQDAGGSPVHVPTVNLGQKVRLLRQVEESVDWLLWEDSGCRLAEVVGEAREPATG